MKSAWEKHQQAIFDGVIALLLFIFPWSMKLPNVVLALGIFLFILRYKSNKNRDWKQLKKPVYILLYVLCGYWFVKGILTQSLGENKYSLMLPLLVIPVLFLQVKNQLWVVRAFLASVILLVVRALIGISIYAQKGDIELFEGGHINEMLGMERPYLSFLSAMAIFMLMGWPHLIAPLKRYWAYIVAAFLLGFLFFVSGRIAVIIVLVNAVIYFLFYLKTAWYKKGGILLVGAGCIALLLYINPGLRERMFLSTSIENTLAKLEHHEPRVIIWGCAFDMIAQPDFNPVIGFDSEKEIDRRYAICFDQTMENKHRSAFFIQRRLNTHNQFLGSFLASGWIGLILLTAVFGALLVETRKNVTAFALTVALLLFCIVEMVLKRQIGVYLFATTLVFVTFLPAYIAHKKMN